LIDPAALYALGIGLIFAGILIIVVAAILLFVAGAKSGKVKGGGVVMVGPVPIIFGTNKKSLQTVLVLSLALTVTLVVAIIVYYLLLR